MFWIFLNLSFEIPNVFVFTIYWSPCRPISNVVLNLKAIVASKYFQRAFSITWFNVSCRPQGSKHYSRSFTTCTNFAETTLTIIFVRQTAVPSQYDEIRFSYICWIHLKYNHQSVKIYQNLPSLKSCHCRIKDGPFEILVSYNGIVWEQWPVAY